MGKLSNGPAVYWRPLPIMGGHHLKGLALFKVFSLLLFGRNFVELF
jgi:hypothetical protein